MCIGHIAHTAFIGTLHLMQQLGIAMATNCGSLCSAVPALSSSDPVTHPHTHTAELADQMRKLAHLRATLAILRCPTNRQGSKMMLTSTTNHCCMMLQYHCMQQLDGQEQELGHLGDRWINSRRVLLVVRCPRRVFGVDTTEHYVQVCPHS
jgi:hypothetical protein